MRLNPILNDMYPTPTVCQHAIPTSKVKIKTAINGASNSDLESVLQVSSLSSGHCAKAARQQGSGTHKWVSHFIPIQDQA